MSLIQYDIQPRRALALAFSLATAFCPLRAFAEGPTLADVVQAVKDNAAQKDSLSILTRTTLRASQGGLHIVMANRLEEFERQNGGSSHTGPEGGEGSLSPEAMVERQFGDFIAGRDVNMIRSYDSDGSKYREQHARMKSADDYLAPSFQFDGLSAFDGTRLRVYTPSESAGYGSNEPESLDVAKSQTSLYGYESRVEQLSRNALGPDYGQTYDPETHTLAVRYGGDKTPVTSRDGYYMKGVFTVVLDPDHGLLPVKMEWSYDRFGPQGFVENLKFASLDAKLTEREGLIYPEQYTVREYPFDRPPKEASPGSAAYTDWLAAKRKTELYTTETVDTLKIDVNPSFSSDHFTLAWPVGTSVLDKVTGAVMTPQIGDEEFASLAAKNIAEVKQNTDQANTSPAAPSSPSAPAPNPSAGRVGQPVPAGANTRQWTYALSAGIILLAMLAVVAVVVRRQARKPEQ